MKNINKLFVNQIVKNYKELCEILNIPIKNGKSKQLQLNDLERYIKYHKVGNKFVIDEIYDKPKEKVDNRTIGNPSIYVKYIELLLLDYLIKQKNEGNCCCYLSSKQLYFTLGMVNRKYIDTNYKSQLQTVDSQFTSWQVNQFYYNTNQRLSKILTSALNNLKRRSILNWSKVYKIIDNDGNNFIADDNQESDIIDAQKEILNEYGLTNIRFIHLKGLTGEFYEKVNQRLNDYYGYQNVYNVYKIVFGTKFLEQDYSQTLKSFNKETEKLELNKLVVSACISTLDNQIQKNDEVYQIAKQKCIDYHKDNDLVLGDFEPSDKDIRKFSDKFILPDNFKIVQQMLIQELVSLLPQQTKDDIQDFIKELDSCDMWD